MASLTGDFLENRKARLSRYKRFALLGIVVLCVSAAAVFGGIYFYPKLKNLAGRKSADSALANSGRLPEVWLLKYFHTPNENHSKVGGVNGDPDGDGLTNLQEYYLAVDPTKSDSDADGTLDGLEVALGTSPRGSGELAVAQDPEEYLKSLGDDFASVQKENIQKKVEEMFQPDQPVPLQMLDLKEFKQTDQNDAAGFEKYYNDTKDLFASDGTRAQDIQGGLFTKTDDEINGYIAELDAAIGALKNTPVPSQIVGIHRLRVAGLLAGIRMLELVRDEYDANSDNAQFWKDFFPQMVASQEAEQLELLAWAEVGQRLHDQGGLNPDAE